MSTPLAVGGGAKDVSEKRRYKDEIEATNEVKKVKKKMPQQKTEV